MQSRVQRKIIYVTSRSDTILWSKSKLCSNQNLEGDQMINSNTSFMVECMSHTNQVQVYKFLPFFCLFFDSIKASFSSQIMFDQGLKLKIQKEQCKTLLWAQLQLRNLKSMAKQSPQEESYQIKIMHQPELGIPLLQVIEISLFLQGHNQKNLKQAFLVQSMPVHPSAYTFRNKAH